MKAKTISKKSLFLVLSLIVLTACICFSASAADCEHLNLSANNWSVVRDATCMMSGLKQQRCPDCLELVNQEIPLDPNAHIKGPWETSKVHTCTQTGIDVRKCTECSEILEKRIVPAHDYSRLYGNDATCMTEGYEVLMCTTCYDMITKTIPIDPDAHQFSEWVITKEATCVVESGERKRFCLHYDKNGVQCTAVEKEAYTDAENHTNIVWHPENTVNPTCYKEGYIPGTCLDCDEEVREVVERHTQSTYKVLSNVPATCVKVGSELRYCDGCGYEYTVELPIDESNHEMSDWIIRKQASCTAGERYKRCIYHSEVEITSEIPANGQHNYGVWTVEIEPDCSKTGLKQKVCADCNDKVTMEIPTKHNFQIWETVTEMNCDETSLQIGSKHAKCKDCNFEKYFTVPANHSFGSWVYTVKADCKTGKAGVKTRTCSVCGKQEQESYTVEHDFTDWFVTSKPSCATDNGSGRDGEYARYCKVCKTRETKVIPATHEFVDWEIIEYPRCYSDGRTESGEKVGYCKFCGKEKIEAVETEHVFGDWSVTKTNSCSSDGVKERKCLVCSFTETEFINAAHKFGDWYAEGGFTCENKTGLLTRQCADCNATEQKSISLNHPNLKVSVVKASCATSGYTTSYCPDCGYTAQTDIVPAKGHTLSSAWKTQNAATCESKGSRYKERLECDYLEFEYIELKAHTLIELEPGVAPTCTQEGKTAKSYCAVCKKVFESQSIAPLGHKFEEGSEICKVCKAYFGSKDCACSCHSTSGMEKIIFSIINKIYQLFGINQKCACGDLHYEEVGIIGQLFGRG